MIRRATKKPVTIEFVEWDSTNKAEIEEFVGRKLYHNALTFSIDTNTLHIPTLEGSHIANIGDMIIKGVKGEFYPSKPDIFALTYDIKDKGE